MEDMLAALETANNFQNGGVHRGTTVDKNPKYILISLGDILGKAKLWYCIEHGVLHWNIHVMRRL